MPYLSRDIFPFCRRARRCTSPLSRSKAQPPSTTVYTAWSSPYMYMCMCMHMCMSCNSISASSTARRSLPPRGVFFRTTGPRWPMRTTLFLRFSLLRAWSAVGDPKNFLSRRITRVPEKFAVRWVHMLRCFTGRSAAAPRARGIARPPPASIRRHNRMSSTARAHGRLTRVRAVG